MSDIWETTTTTYEIRFIVKRDTTALELLNTIEKLVSFFNPETHDERMSILKSISISLHGETLEFSAKGPSSSVPTAKE